MSTEVIDGEAMRTALLLVLRATDGRILSAQEAAGEAHRIADEALGGWPYTK